jgi:hypothetical protein
LLFFSSCIKEDWSGCDKGMRVMFFDPGDEIPAIGSDEIQSLVLYVYDDKDGLIKTETIEKPSLNDLYELALPISEGSKYSLIAWATRDTSFVVEQPESRSQARIKMKISSGTREQGETIFSLFYGNTDTVLTETKDVVIPVPLRRNSNKINVFFHNFTNPDTYGYNFLVNDNNNVYSFDNNIVDSDNFSYSVKGFVKTDDVPVASIMVLKLNESHHPTLNVHGASDALALINNLDLLSVIQANYPNDWKKRHEFDIHIYFSGLEITIEGWGSITIDGPLAP